MSTDIFNGMSFNDGEGIVHTDFNNLSRYQLARLMDQILHQQIGSISIASANRDMQMGGQDGSDHPTSRAYCLNPGSAFLRQGSGNSKIQLAPGTLMQKIAAMSGSEAQLIPYTFAGTEEWTLTNGDATNVRVDLLQMKLEWIDSPTVNRDFEDATTRIVTSTLQSVNRRVQATLSVKAGVVGSPTAATVPEPDAGYVAVGLAIVGNGWTTAGAAPIFGADTAATNNVVICDVRMPIGVRAYTVDSTQMKALTSWTLDTTKEFISATSATNLFYAAFPSKTIGRIVGFSVTQNPSTIAMTTGYTLGYVNTNLSGFVTRNTFTSANAATSTGFFDEMQPFFTLEAAHNPALGPTITPSVTTKIGVPLWTNGQRAPIERNRLLSLVNRPPGYLCFRGQNVPISGGFTTQIHSVTFYVAEGL